MSPEVPVDYTWAKKLGLVRQVGFIFSTNIRPGELAGQPSKPEDLSLACRMQEARELHQLNLR